jgi:hypothetical protein
MSPHWRKSSYSSGSQQCVELAHDDGDGDGALLRDSKHPDQGHLTLTPTAITTLIHAAKTGNLDHLTH